MIIVVMGVSGSGKSTIGRALAGRLGLAFCEGDELHPPANVEKMARGEPLTDADRWPWLAALRRWMDNQTSAGQSGVMACSALKRAYRDVLCSGDSEVCFVYLQAPTAWIRQRLQGRDDHFMPVSLLNSQLAALEEPVEAIHVDARQSKEQILDRIQRQLPAMQSR